MAKFYTINPRECSIEELKAAIAECNAKQEYYGALEQGCKKFINSVYGALGSAYYVCANTAIAESVTLQGQDLIKFSARKVNFLVGTLWTKLNALVKSKMYIVDKETDDIVGIIYYNSPEEDLSEWKNILTAHPEEYSIVLTKESIGIGYSTLINNMCSKDENTGEKYLSIDGCDKHFLNDKELLVGERKQSGVQFNADVYSFEYLFNRLNIYRRIGYDMKTYDENFNIDEFVENCKTPIVFPESTKKVTDDGEEIYTLQCYGDSCTGDTVILYDDSESIIKSLNSDTIENLFEKYKSTCVGIHGKEYVTPSSEFYISNFYDGEVQTSKVAHIIRHKVGKDMYCVTSASGKSVKITKDHSIVMFDIDSGEIVNVCPNDIKENHRLITRNNNGSYSLEAVKEVANYSYNSSLYVYDIEIASVDLKHHNFFGNDILLHNTDSVSKDSVITTSKHPEGITIEAFYNENKDNFAGETVVGHESVSTEDKVLNWFNGFYYGNVERIIRHKVTKDKWEIKSCTGESVTCTGDHSLVVFRNDQKTIVGPKDVCVGDKLLVKDGKSQDFVLVSQCDHVGLFDNEYVYDIEMNDETHTFMCNDVLVHNSAYITLQPLVESCKIPAELATYFILSFNDNVMSDYLGLQFESYAKKYNCPKNLENFELEKIARSLLMQKKKKYVMDIAWTDSHIFYDPLKKLVFKGVEAVKGESSQFVRKEQKDFVKWIIDNINQGKELKYPEIVGHIKAIKDRFVMATPDDMCITKSLSDYDKYIVNDKGSKVIFAENVVITFHAKASSWYNNMLYTKAKEYRSRYDIIRKGDKVRLYYVNEPPDQDHKVFAFLPGNFPVEFAPAIDMNEMFNKLILDPLNRYVEALGYNPIGPRLTYKTSLF